MSCPPPVPSLYCILKLWSCCCWNWAWPISFKQLTGRSSAIAEPFLTHSPCSCCFFLLCFIFLLIYSSLSTLLTTSHTRKYSLYTFFFFYKLFFPFTHIQMDTWVLWIWCSEGCNNVASLWSSLVSFRWWSNIPAEVHVYVCTFSSWPLYQPSLVVNCLEVKRLLLGE